MFHNKEYAYEVYKTKSFSKAATNLFISQPALSAAIKKIENRLGSPIFDRSTTPIRLTPSGEKYIQYIEQLLEMEQELEQDLNDLNQLKSGHLVLGGSNLFSSYILPPLIAAYKKKYPQVEVKLIEANTKALEKKLFEGELDLVLDNYHFSDEVYNHHFFQEEHLLLAVPVSFQSNIQLSKLNINGLQLTANNIRENIHLKKECPLVPLETFYEDPFLLLRSGNDTRERSDILLKNASITPNIVLKLDQQVTAYHIACYGMGATFVTDTLIKQVPEDPRIVFYKIADDNAIRNIYFYHKRGKYVTRAMHAFLDLLKE